jgi:hypothetical protein
MAGVKVTDLPVLSAADLADIFYVVDASGVQSKQVDLQTIANALSTALPYIHLKGTAFGGQGQVTGDVEVDVAAGGLITLRYGNGDIFALGVDYGGYSAISFYDAGANETAYLYLRGGDLYLANPDASIGVGALMATITGLQATKVGFADIDVDIQGSSGQVGLIRYPLSTTNAYLESTTTGRTGMQKLTKYFAKYSAYISQTSTSAPTENHIIESDFANPFCSASYAWAYVSTGHYHLNITGGIADFIVNSNKTIVRFTNGEVTNVCIRTEIAQTIPNGLQISIRTANPQTGNLANGLITKSLIEVEFYS